jgi:hypothetical protein
VGGSHVDARTGGDAGVQRRERCTSGGILDDRSHLDVARDTGDLDGAGCHSR